MAFCTRNTMFHKLDLINVTDATLPMSLRRGAAPKQSSAAERADHSKGSSDTNYRQCIGARAGVRQLRSG